jgi:hypothetical protein
MVAPHPAILFISFTQAAVESLCESTKRRLWQGVQALCSTLRPGSID